MALTLNIWTKSICLQNTAEWYLLARIHIICVFQVMSICCNKFIINRMAVTNAFSRLSLSNLTRKNARLADMSYCKWLQTRASNTLNGVFRFYGNISNRKQIFVCLPNSYPRYYSRPISDFPSFSTNNYEGKQNGGVF